MPSRFFFTLLMVLLHTISSGQQVLGRADVNARHSIELAKLEGWKFHPGSDRSLADPQADLSGWISLQPGAIDAWPVDAQGISEGWFRIVIELDPALAHSITGLHSRTWAAKEVYIDGIRVHQFGLIDPYVEYRFSQKLPVYLNIGPGKHVVAIHVKDQRSAIPLFKLKSAFSSPGSLLALTLPGFTEEMIRSQNRMTIHGTIWITVGALLSFLFWLMYFRQQKDKTLLLISLHATCATLSSLATFLSTSADMSFPGFRLLDIAWSFFGWMMIGLTVLIPARILQGTLSMWVKVFFLLVATAGLIDGFIANSVLRVCMAAICLILFMYYLILGWRKAQGAQWAVIIGLLLTLIWLILWAVSREWVLATPILLSFPLSLLVYVSMRFQEILAETQSSAARIVQLAEEKKQLISSQNEMLEQQVAQRTVELQNSLDELTRTQSQLIQSEKMASLGELTAGIAHEIKNPLNFVNNFSELSKELLDELKQALEQGNTQLANQIVADVMQNLDKVHNHGERADAIVKSMLQHARTSTGVKEPTDINALVDEYLRLAYHGHRAKDKSFNAQFETSFDPALPKVPVIPQDLGRVLLNLINNAFQACRQRAQAEISMDREYKPLVTVKTKLLGPFVEIRITDNGIGIPAGVIEKIFQPFFTTKAAGQGTGLGLSISYDIIRAHGGQITVSSNPRQENAVTVFTIHLPIKNPV